MAPLWGKVLVLALAYVPVALWRWAAMRLREIEELLLEIVRLRDG